MDNLTKERRSWNMGRIRSSNTEPEIKVRSALHRMGFRFRLHVKALPGKPDIVLPKWRHVIFVHGCFWHRHIGCKYAYTPKTRTEFWDDKFRQNLRRDEMAERELQLLGWEVSTIWECQTANPDGLGEILKRLARRFKLGRQPFRPSRRNTGSNR